MTIRPSIFTGLNVGVKTSTLSKYGEVPPRADIYATAFVEAAANAIVFNASADITASATVTGAGLASFSGAGDISATATVTAASGPNTLTDLDYRTPLASWTTGRTGFSSASADESWDMQTYSGGYANAVGTDPLTNVNGGLTGQSAPAIHNGTSYGTRNCWERNSTTVNQRLACGSGATLDTNTSDFSGRLVFSLVGSPGAFAYLLDKLTASTGGWDLRFNSAGAVNPAIQLHDGTNYFTASGMGTFNDGAVHYLSWWWDVSAEMLYIKGDKFSEASVSTATRVGGMANPGKALQVCNNATLGPIQIHHLSGAVGANAAAHYAETFWQHAQDPSGLLTTTSRSTPIKVPISATQTATFTGGTTVGTCQLPIGYSSVLTGGYGLYCNSAITNLVLRSRRSTGATNSNVTATDFASDAADGFRAATTLAATANNGYQAKVVTTTASTAYTASVRIKEVTTGVTGRVIAYDESNAAELASSVFTATSNWVDVQVPFSTIGGGVSTSIRVEVDTSGETVAVDDWQINLGNHRGHTITTAGSTGTSAFSHYQADGAAGQFAKHASGEFEFVYTGNRPRTGNIRYLGIYQTTGSNSAYTQLWGTSAATNFLWAYDSVGTQYSSLTAAVDPTGIEAVAVYKWDSAGGLSTSAGAMAALDVNGTSPADAVGTFATTDVQTGIVLANYRSASDTFAFDGVISRLQIFDGER